MTPEFASAELNHLLQLELAEGTYRSVRSVLAGLKALRKSREFRSQWPIASRRSRTVERSFWAATRARRVFGLDRCRGGC